MPWPTSIRAGLVKHSVTLSNGRLLTPSTPAMTTRDAFVTTSVKAKLTVPKLKVMKRRRKKANRKNKRRKKKSKRKRKSKSKRKRTITMEMIMTRTMRKKVVTRKKLHSPRLMTPNKLSRKSGRTHTTQQRITRGRCTKLIVRSTSLRRN